VVLTTGCDKTTPACLMAAATVNLPAIVLSGGPMLNGWHQGKRTGSGTVVWKRARTRRRRHRLRAVHEHRGLLGPVGRPLQHDGHRRRR
jgi:dihydroxyacid dehydratase/phosphogluconate dehydratase